MKITIHCLAIAVASLLCAALAQGQNLFVSDWNNGNIYEFTPNGGSSTFASGFSHPNCLAFDSSGNLFVTCANDGVQGYIVKIAPDGGKSTFATGLASLNELAFDKAGNLFVTAINLYEFTPNGGRSTFASGFNRPDGLTFDSAGNLFVTDAGAGCIYEFATGGGKSTFACGLARPAGLAFDSAGNLFDADYGSGNVYKFTTGGVKTVFASGLGVGNACRLAFNGAGNLFLSGGNSGNIYEYTPNGTPSTFATGLNDPIGLTIQPVPLSTCPSIVGTWTGQMNVANAWSGYSTVPLSVRVTDQSTNGCLIRGYLTQGNVSNSFSNIRFGWNPWFRMPFTGAIPDASTVLLNVSGVGSGKASAILDMSQTPPVLTKFVYQPDNGDTLTGDLTLQPSSP